MTFNWIEVCLIIGVIIYLVLSSWDNGWSKGFKKGYTRGKEDTLSLYCPHNWEEKSHMYHQDEIDHWYQCSICGKKKN